MPRLSWNQIRANAARFAEEWKDAHYERGETQSFYNEFFEVFGIRRRKVASFEHPVRNLAEGKRGYLDLFWKSALLVEQKSAGRKLHPAKPGIRLLFWITRSHRPHSVILSAHTYPYVPVREWTPATAHALYPL